MALKTPYCTVAEAIGYLVDSVIWEAAESEEQESALFWARMYFDANYTCIEFDEDDPTDEIKYANALLAEDYLDGNLVETASTLSGNVKKESKKLEGLAKSVEYSSAGQRSGNAQQDVDFLLKGTCTKNSAGEISLTRS